MKKIYKLNHDKSFDHVQNIQSNKKTFEIFEGLRYNNIAIDNYRNTNLYN